jgi:hypothetical protein
MYPDKSAELELVSSATAAVNVSVRIPRRIVFVPIKTFFMRNLPRWVQGIRFCPLVRQQQKLTTNVTQASRLRVPAASRCQTVETGTVSVPELAAKSAAPQLCFT